LCRQNKNDEIGTFYFVPENSKDLTVYENDQRGSKKACGERSSEEVFPRAVKRFSMYPSNDKFGRVDGLRNTTTAVEDALNREGMTLCMRRKAMVKLSLAQSE
jgi:hypothetical protein